MNVLTDLNIIMLLGGVFLGVLLSASGLSGALGMSLLLPLCFVLKPEAAFVGLLAIYCGANLRRGWSALFGSLAAVVLAMFVMPYIVSFATRMTPSEVLALAIFVMVSLVFAGKRFAGASRALVSLALGLLVPTIGIYTATGVQRFSFGFEELHGGIDFVVVALGVCCVGEILFAVNEKTSPFAFAPKGSPEDESSASAREIGYLIPALSLGMPCTVETAILVGFSGIFSASSIGVVLAIAAAAKFIFAAIFKRILERANKKWAAFPPPICLFSLFVTFAFCGAYSLNYRVFDMLLLILFGILGFAMRKFEFPVSAFMVGLVLSSRVEQAFWAPFELNWLVFLLLMAALSTIFPYISRLSRKQDKP